MNNTNLTPGTKVIQVKFNIMEGDIGGILTIRKVSSFGSFFCAYEDNFEHFLGCYEEYKGKQDDSPRCYTPNDEPYPLCRGAITPNGIAENDCYSCCLYEDYEKFREDEF